MPFARQTDIETSHEAAASVKNITATQQAIMKLIQIHPMTDQRLIDFYQAQIRMGADARDFPRASESGIRSRRAELVDRGLIKDSGARETLESGRSAVVWTVG